MYVNYIYTKKAINRVNGRTLSGVKGGLASESGGHTSVIKLEYAGETGRVFYCPPICERNPGSRIDLEIVVGWPEKRGRRGEVGGEF